MLVSPDLTWSQTDSLIEEFKGQLVSAHERAQKFKVMKEDQVASSELDFPEELRRSTFAKERGRSFSQAQKLLEL
jgi:hypothetical protein